MANELKPADVSNSVKHEELRVLTTGLPPGWAVRLVESEAKTTKRLHYVRHVNRSAQWIPPPEYWRCPNLLPYGWELGIDDDGHVYYVNHLNEITTRRDPRIHASLDDNNPHRKEFLLEKGEKDEGFGFTLSDNPPYVVKSVTTGGAAAPWLSVNDTVSRIGNVEVFGLSKDEVSELLVQAAGTGTVKIQVVNDAESPAEATNPQVTQDGKLATHLLPGVLLVDLMTGGSRKFRITKTTTVQDIVHNVCKRLEITTPDMFGLYIETVAPQKTTLKTLYGWQLLARLPKEIIDSMVANDTEGGQEPNRTDEANSTLVRVVCRLRFLPGSVDDLFEVDRRAFEYFFHQTALDIANDQFAMECPNDVALILGSLSIAHFCLKHGKKKISLKEVEKMVGGLQPFFPSSIMDRLKPGELRKHVKRVLESQEVDIEQPDPMDLHLKYLTLVSDFPTLGGDKFKCVDEESLEDTVILVSPQHGFASIDSPLEDNWCSEIQITTLSCFDGLEAVKVEHLEEPSVENLDTRVTIIFEDSSLDPRKFVLTRESAREMVHLLHGYTQLLAKAELAVDDPVLLLESKLETDRAPEYRSLHHVVDTYWSYFENSWQWYEEAMGKQAASPASHKIPIDTASQADTQEHPALGPGTSQLAFPVGTIQIDKSSLPDYTTVDLSFKLAYGKRKKRRVVYLRKTGADLARDFLNLPEKEEEEEEDFTAHLSSRQMVNTTASDNVDGDDDEDTSEAKQQAPKQSSGAAAALASLLSRSAPVVDESEGSATAQPLRGMVGTAGYVSSNTLGFGENATDGVSSTSDSGWGGSGGQELDVAAAAAGGAEAPAEPAGWGDEDDSKSTASKQQPSLSEFGVSVRSNHPGFGFGDSPGGGHEEDEIAGW